MAVTAKLRHGELWKLVEQFGSQAEAARQIGCTAQEFCSWVNMRAVPAFKSERFEKIEVRLMELTGKTAEDLWPDAVRSDEWLSVPKSVVAHQQFKLAALQDMTRRRLLLPSPADTVEAAEMDERLKERIAGVLKTLSYREREVIKLRYGLGPDGHEYTYEELGHVFGITRERMRQVEAKAIRKMQQPTMSGELVEFVG